MVLTALVLVLASVLIFSQVKAVFLWLAGPKSQQNCSFYRCQVWLRLGLSLRFLRWFVLAFAEAVGVELEAGAEFVVEMGAGFVGFLYQTFSSNLNLFVVHVLDLEEDSMAVFVEGYFLEGFLRVYLMMTDH